MTIFVKLFVESVICQMTLNTMFSIVVEQDACKWITTKWLASGEPRQSRPWL